MTDDNSSVLVAMSGGVDSSVAAALLSQQGRNVIGVSMRLPTYGGRQDGNAPCCGVRGIDDARRVAARLGMPFYALDMREQFREAVIRDFCRSYAVGRTPNPCARCNERVKFGALLRKARALGADYVATGHYVARQPDPKTGRIRLRAGRGADDQSYFLYGLTQQQLARAIFPMAGHTKEEARRIARRLGLKVHDKPGSQDLCFLPDGRYRDFLRAEQPDDFRSGPIMHVSGRVMGRHDGICDYTVGQRRGLGVAHSEPLYVTALRPGQDAVVVGEREHVMRREVELSEVNWLSVPRPEQPVEAAVKIRYNHPGAPALVEPTGPGTARVEFCQPQAAPAPGQAAVFYRDELVLGGGTIEG